MNKLYSAALLMLASLGMDASEGGVKSNANKNEVRYITNSKRLPDQAYQQELRERDAWKDFLGSNGTWYVIFNEENARPHRAFGKPIPVFGMNAEAKALNFISSKLSGFQIPVSDLALSGTGSSESYQYVHFHQKYHGLKVLNSDLYVKLTPSGSVTTFGCDVFSDITVSTSPSISSAAAITAAQAGIADAVTATSINPDLFILPVPEFKQNIYKLVYEVTVSTLDDTGIPAKYLTLVDAETGAVVSRVNQVKHSAPEKPAKAPMAATDVTVAGTVYPTNPYDPSAMKPLTNLELMESSLTYNTDSFGFVGLPAATSTTVTVKLQGLWSQVFTSGITPTFSAIVNPGTNTLTFDTDANIRERSAYYHVNIVHDYMKTKFPSFTDMDNPLPTNVDEAGTCNAYYDGSSINFYANGGGCNSLAQVGDVVYHEYGHGINDKFYQSQGAFFTNGALGEGYADLWAMGITANPLLGVGFDDADPTVVIRRYDIDKKVYPQDLVGEVHADGEIIAGCWWDTGLNFGNLQQMMDLYKETFYAVVAGPDGSEGSIFVDVLIEALNADDVPANGGDNDITNGTPNDNAIVDGFDLHGITLLSNAVVTHTAVTSSAAVTNIPINANITVTYPWALASAKVFYKLNRTGAWTGLAMTNTSGTAYTASIPAQPAGTVIAYYIGLEGTTGSLSAVQPIAADQANPNLPHYILNGVALLSEEDFDVNFGAWLVGDPADDATTGLWTVDEPVGSFSTPGDASTVVQPASQHTIGGMYCAITGNAPGTSSALGTNDVDAGQTTIFSPAYNLSTYINPIFTYYRWYINNPPSGANPANDFWQVQISNNGSTWVTVEHTNVSDKTWRRNAIRVTDYVPLSANVQMRFIAEDSLITTATLNGGSIVEAALDDFYLYEQGSVGINENNPLLAVTVYPNPASSAVNVTYELLSNEEVKIELLNNLGQVVYNGMVNESPAGKHTVRIETGDLASGLYMLSIRTAQHSHLQKVSVTR